MTLLWHAQLPQDDSLIFNFVALIYLYVLLISLQHCMQYHIVVGGSCYNSPAGFYLISGVLPLAKHLKSGKKHDHHWQISLFFLANNTLRRRQNARHFAEGTFNRIFINENIRISIKFSLKFVPKGPISNIQALVQIMPWRHPGDKPLSEPVMVIGIDHDTVCAGVVGTAIRNSTSCAGRRAAAPAGTTSAVPDCSTNHDSADRISGQFLFYHDHNLQKVRETCVFDVLYRCSSPSAFA